MPAPAVEEEEPQKVAGGTVWQWTAPPRRIRRPRPVVGSARVELPAVVASGVGTVRMVGVASVLIVIDDDDDVEVLAILAIIKEEDGVTS